MRLPEAITGPPVAIGLYVHALRNLRRVRTFRPLHPPCTTRCLAYPSGDAKTCLEERRHATCFNKQNVRRGLISDPAVPTTFSESLPALLLRRFEEDGYTDQSTIGQAGAGCGEISYTANHGKDCT